MNDRGPHLRLTAPPASRPLRHPPRPCLREGGGSALPVRRRCSLSTRFRSRRSAAAAAAASEAKARQRAPCAGVCVCARARARALVLGGLKGSACGAGSLRGPPQPASALQGDSEGWPAVGLGWAPPPGRGSASVPELGGVGQAGRGRRRSGASGHGATRKASGVGGHDLARPGHSPMCDATPSRRRRPPSLTRFGPPSPVRFGSYGSPATVPGAAAASESHTIRASESARAGRRRRRRRRGSS